MKPVKNEQSQAHWREAEAKGNPEAVRESRDTAIKGKQEASAPKEKLAASATTKAIVEEAKMSVKPLALLLLHSKSPTRNSGKNSSKMELPEEAVLLVESSRSRAKKYLKEICTDPSCKYWHPPGCQKYQAKVLCQ